MVVSVPQEIAIVGDLTENASDLVDKVLGVEPEASALFISIRLVEIRTQRIL